jgi:serine/threonine-protein kinase HipA
LDNNKLAAPPVASLSQLAAVAHEITNKNINDLDALRKWLSVLVAPGASLGGARPKANFTDNDGSAWIAKFPARDDGYDVGAWEGVVHNLAEKAGVDVPTARVIRFGKGHHTFCVKRFDRTKAGRRRFYASAMTALRKTESEGSSYLDLAYHLQTTGSPTKIKSDLEQLFRRVVFNVAASNRDDHLRNHGFIMSPDGWELSPAFDINPNVNKVDHVLNLDDSDNRPSIDTVLCTAVFYGLNEAEARAIISHVVGVVRGWRMEATKAGISRAEIEEMSSAFAAAELTQIENAVANYHHDSAPKTQPDNDFDVPGP